MKFINAQIYDTNERRFKLGSLSTENGIFVSDSSNEITDLKGKRIIPGMIDIHTHGHGGYESTAVDKVGMEKMALSYASVGTTSFMLTMMSLPFSELEHCIDTAKEAKNHEGANTLGIYLEGRYISEAKKGAHDTRFIATPNADELEKLIVRAKDVGCFYTICAPEVDGTKELVERAKKLGVCVAIGHSNATYEQCAECIGWGANSFTHLYNAMSGLSHRAPGCVGAALANDTFVELICDGVHVSPAAVKVAYRAKNDKLILITDSAPAAGLQSGNYKMGGADVVVRDGAVFLKDGTLTGGSISLFEAVKNLSKFADIPFEDAIPTATENPAKLLGVYDKVGSLDIGKSADMIVIDDMCNIDSVYVRGNRITL